MRKLSLFSGIGGIDLAAHWAGMETVAFCEREPFPQQVLRKHWPMVPIYDDVRNVTKERLQADGIDTDSIGIISAGYPCQPFSNAGQRKGEADDRHLWPEVSRILQEIRPPWFVGENVAGHITLGLDDVLDDLDNIGYTAQPFVIPAGAVDAQHERARVFILAYTDCQRLQGGQVSRGRSQMRQRAEQQFQGLLQTSTWSKVSAADFSRATYGVSRRMDEHRIKALGNAVVPYQIYPILAAIKAINDSL
ncbi:DNA cytosine methyltransferase [Paenibacillus ottowii]|uniref:DNA (cytosine-5-)-methyltransferase n=1 Tax=Paenibacillus ottowii TaxID=2315729 RepID=A0ABY3B7Z2_9BACL|nr:DNA cytosine methyltransferase [Paenibacillus ottowii]TQS00070.1 DNA (cytosine-5-)-methyltransferase [Paenibacillus ottowii]TQS00139.1 DNA (cytosine-5-)-methyltransferase [Paenibacillus ottowii]